MSLGDMSDQIGGDALRASFELVDELGVPEVVKISGSEAGRRYLLVIAATVIVVRAVQRLMQVADEMKEKLQRHDLLFVVGRGIG